MKAAAFTVVVAASARDRADCNHLRRVVFIEEQGISERDEYDDLDDVCVHFLARAADGTPLGTARLYFTDDGKAKAQRVAVVQEARKLGVGRAVMVALEREALTRGHDEVVLGAQVSAIPFYLAQSYETFGEPFDDAGIPHRWMRKRIR
jgi:predicted GNAT family N-acyltransferase